MTVILVDGEDNWVNLLPLTFTRPVSEIRAGILTIREKWEHWLQSNCSYLTRPHLAEKFKIYRSEDSLFISSNLLPDARLVKAIRSLRRNEGLMGTHGLIAWCGSEWPTQRPENVMKYEETYTSIDYVWDIFLRCGEEVSKDFTLITKGRRSAPLNSSVTVIGDAGKIFLEEGAKANACTINTTGGPVFIGEEAEIMEGCVVRGPFALCEHSILKMSAKVYGPTVIGPHSKVGGEVSNSVVFGYSNKAHDGFLGNSVVGEWCNLGADTNNSNLKNNYANVKLYNYLAGKAVDTGHQFCGLIMGDHSKCGINTMFNTGTVVGVGCNIFGGGFPPTHIPSFSWGGGVDSEKYKLDKFFETAERVYERRGMEFDKVERDIIRAVEAMKL
jgi:UDP-N-acetylglucosamine diphosphorylase/glucosamine-1-phosphate N-acetyltransferase